MYYEVVLEALIDTARLIPFLFAVHLLIGFLEVRKTGRIKRGVMNSRLAPLVGTGLALLPQCGFSVVASELYAKRFVTVGTLVAVFIATSDEALPILIGEAAVNPSVWAALGLLIGIKTVMALAAGYGTDIVASAVKRRRARKAEASGAVSSETELPAETSRISERAEDCADEHRAHDESHGESEYLHAHEHGCCGHSIGEGGKGIFVKYFKHPLIHTAWITLFVFVINLALGSIIFAVKEENFIAFMNGGKYVQPLVATLIGLIPNCASSVMITELFADGALTLGAAVAGLAINAGLGVAVLVKENKNAKQNALIIGGMVLLALAVGYALTPFGAIA